MLAVKTYPQEHIDGCRARIERQLAAYETLLAAAGGDPAGSTAVAAFEPQFLNNLVVVLDGSFVHRTRAIEGKDGNPLNEVRMLASSILTDGAVLAADKTIKYKAETSVSKLAVGDEIRLDLAQFRALAEAFFAEIEAKFT